MDVDTEKNHFILYLQSKRMLLVYHDLQQWVIEWMESRLMEGADFWHVYGGHEYAFQVECTRQMPKSCDVKNCMFMLT